MMFAARCLLVVLFLPFSALDKILNAKAAVRQAAQIVPARSFARILILGGFGVEVVMSLAVLTGIVDRLAGFILPATASLRPCCGSASGGCRVFA